MAFRIPSVDDFIRVVAPATPRVPCDRFELARAEPGGVRLTPAQQAAKNLAELLMAKHADAHAACGTLYPAIDRDMAIVATASTAEAIRTAEDRLELHRLAIEFIVAAHMRAGTMPPTFDDEDPVVDLASADFDIPPLPERTR